MPKKAVSVTLDVDNVLWLQGQATVRSLSEVLDNLVTDARHGGRIDKAATVRSVRGTIDLPADDPDLVKADEYVRALFEHSLSRPMAVREPRAKYGPRTKRSSAKRGSRA